MDYQKYIENNTIRCKAGYRGGGIEINLQEMFPSLDEPTMTAWQNYLGGGMLGKIGHSYSFDPEELEFKDQDKLEEITEELKRYFHNLTNHEADEWESETYEKNQLKDESAY